MTLVPALAISFVGKPFLRARAALADQVSEQSDLLQRELALVQSTPRVSIDLSAVTQALAEAGPLLLPARDALGATAFLVSAVSENARRQGLVVETVESRPAETLSDGLVAVQVGIQGRGDLEGVLRWLNALETGPRLLRVEQLSVARIGPETQPDSLDVETLTFAASVRGFLLASTTFDLPGVSQATPEGQP